ANSAGFSGTYRGTYRSLVMRALADDEGGKKRSGLHFTSARYRSDLLDPREVGKRAAEIAARKIGARKIPTCEAPVVFDPEAARSPLAPPFPAITPGA